MHIIWILFVIGLVQIWNSELLYLLVVGVLFIFALFTFGYINEQDKRKDEPKVHYPENYNPFTMHTNYR